MKTQNLAVALAVSIAACASPGPRYEAPEPRALGRDLRSAPAPVFREPTGEITLAEALEAALINSPELASFSWETRAREAEALQAALRPNPELGAEVANFAGSGSASGFSASETTVGLSQLIELGGKRAKRLALAERERDLAAWDYETARVDVLTTVRQAFVDVLAIQAQVALAEDLVAVAEDGLESVSRRVKAGAVSPVEESRARVELEISRVDREQNERALSVARRRLAATWGVVSPRSFRAIGDLETLAVPPSLEEIAKRIEQSPELARWASELDRRRAALDLAEAQRVPDVTVGAAVRRLAETEDAAFVLELGLPLPLFDRGQGASEAAGMRLRQADEERRVARVRILARLSSAHEELLAAGSEVVALRERVIPQADAAFLAAQDAYQRGLMRFTDVLDTKRSVFELRARSFRALARYHRAAAALERLVGESLETPAENRRP